MSDLRPCLGCGAAIQKSRTTGRCRECRRVYDRQWKLNKKNGVPPKPKLYQILGGQRFGRLVAKTLTTRAGVHHSLKHAWVCECDCGAETTISAALLMRGETTSCGCLAAETHRTHGQSATDVYVIWQSMRKRCANQKARNYRWYGARGIRVCDRWLNSFENFIADMGPRPSPQHTIDRIDNDGNYEPGNCRWATWDVQAKNKRPRQITKEIITCG